MCFVSPVKSDIWSFRSRPLMYSGLKIISIYAETTENVPYFRN